MTAHFWSNSGIVAVSDDTNNNPLNLKQVFRLKLPKTIKNQSQQILPKQ